MNSAIIREDCGKLLDSFAAIKQLFNKTFLIAGSNGLIGNYLVNALSLANERYGANINAYCISKHAPAWKDDRFSYLTLDLSQPFSFEFPVDYVVHCACYGRPQKFLENELETIALNVDATKMLLDIAKASRAKFLFASTSEIYGNPPPEHIPTRETYPGNSLTSNGRAAYVESKRLGETLCYVYRRNHHIEAKVARIALVYGPGISINDERVMGNFIKKALVDKHIKLIDSGESLRTYCYISDALNMLFRILLDGNDILYNVGGVDVVSVYQMASIIADYCGASCERGSGVGMKDAPNIVRLDIGKACREFKIDKFVPFKEGLQRTIDWNIGRQKG